MKLVVDGVERECQVCPAPKGSFCIYGYMSDGRQTYSYYFPKFVAVAEYDDGTVATCPLAFSLETERADIDVVFDVLSLEMLKMLIDGKSRTDGITREEAAEEVIYDFVSRGVILRRDAKEYVMRRD